MSIMRWFRRPRRGRHRRAAAAPPGDSALCDEYLREGSLKCWDDWLEGRAEQ